MVDLVETFYFLTESEAKLLRLKKSLSGKSSTSNSPNASSHDIVALKGIFSSSASNSIDPLSPERDGSVSVPPSPREEKNIDKALETFDELEFGNPSDRYGMGNVSNQLFVFYYHQWSFFFPCCVVVIHHFCEMIFSPFAIFLSFVSHSLLGFGMARSTTLSCDSRAFLTWNSKTSSSSAMRQSLSHASCGRA
jgi:hypothetical protein